jgi:hypothetical protein
MPLSTPEVQIPAPRLTEELGLQQLSLWGFFVGVPHVELCYQAERRTRVASAPYARSVGQ